VLCAVRLLVFFFVGFGFWWTVCHLLQDLSRLHWTGRSANRHSNSFGFFFPFFSFLRASSPPPSDNNIIIIMRIDSAGLCYILSLPIAVLRFPPRLVPDTCTSYRISYIAVPHIAYSYRPFEPSWSIPRHWLVIHSHSISGCSVMQSDASNPVFCCCFCRLGGAKGGCDGD